MGREYPDVLSAPQCNNHCLQSTIDPSCTPKLFAMCSMNTGSERQKQKETRGQRWFNFWITIYKQNTVKPNCLKKKQKKKTQQIFILNSNAVSKNVLHHNILCKG